MGVLRAVLRLQRCRLLPRAPPPPLGWPLSVPPARLIASVRSPVPSNAHSTHCRGLQRLWITAMSSKRAKEADISRQAKKVKAAEVRVGRGRRPGTRGS